MCFRCNMCTCFFSQRTYVHLSNDIDQLIDYLIFIKKKEILRIGYIPFQKRRFESWIKNDTTYRNIDWFCPFNRKISQRMKKSFFVKFCKILKGAGFTTFRHASTESRMKEIEVIDVFAFSAIFRNSGK